MLEEYETLQLAGNLMNTNQVDLLQFMRWYPITKNPWFLMIFFCCSNLVLELTSYSTSILFETPLLCTKLISFIQKQGMQ